MQLPTAFEERTRLFLGEEYPAFIKALNETPPTSIRVNDKMNYVPSSQKVAWCESGYYLPERPSFTSDPFFHAGVYYVQEASSMFLQQAINQQFPDAKNILDICAAPGGKTTLLSQSFDNDTLIVSNEIIRSRVKILAENVIKWGNANVIVTNNEPADFSKLSGFFDAVIVDAPCSGEGLFRKNPAAIQEWSVDNVQKCAARQRKIVQDVWDALKTGGILVYSTCTYNREENEENVFWICKELGAELLDIDVSRWKNITVSDGGYRFYPHKIRGEGFFLSILRKTAKTPIRSYSLKKKETSKMQPISLPSISLKRPENWIFELNNQQLKAYPKNRWKEIQLIQQTFSCVLSEIKLGEIKNEDFIPSAQLALSKELNLNTVEKIEVNYQTAIQFLKKEPLIIDFFKKGFILLTYTGQPLGWLKNLGNRYNNLYPNEWRIRMKINE